MTNEDFLLLRADLCGRIPYKVKVNYRGDVYNLISCGIDKAEILRDTDRVDLQDGWNGRIIDELKPFLRPMSAMTDTEREELCVSLDTSVYGQARYLDWLNAHHYDYRDLIGKGLALKAPEGMY